eukprot:2606726-Amphidinium_carterae.1
MIDVLKGLGHIRLQGQDDFLAVSRRLRPYPKDLRRKLAALIGGASMLGQLPESSFASHHPGPRA